MFSFEQNYVMQFEDGSFLKKGVFHGFVLEDNLIKIGRTYNLKEALTFAFKHDAFRVAHDLRIAEPYETKEIEIVYKLKE